MLRSTTLPVLPCRLSPLAATPAVPSRGKRSESEPGLKEIEDRLNRDVRHVLPGQLARSAADVINRSHFALLAFLHRSYKTASQPAVSLAFPALSFLAMFFRPSNARVPFSQLVNYADLAGRERCVSRLVYGSAGILPLSRGRLVLRRGG
jgi:hypothetical protein